MVIEHNDREHGHLSNFERGCFQMAKDQDVEAEQILGRIRFSQCRHGLQASSRPIDERPRLPRFRRTPCQNRPRWASLWATVEPSGTTQRSIPDHSLERVITKHCGGQGLIDTTAVVRHPWIRAIIGSSDFGRLICRYRSEMKGFRRLFAPAALVKRRRHESCEWLSSLIGPADGCVQ